ncbi:YciI family protein [Viridibacterium curvum]|uniref:YCII-related domain-containing protein n=1 Tax=Viridibacterium curvum TaxID=1101404 RepID=A0ABP9QM14_9RHOO
MLYVVRFYDRADQLAVREQYLQAPVDWLDANKDVVLIGGSLRESPGAKPDGGMWLVEAESRAAVEALMQTDPFWVHGLRERYELHFWRKAFPDRKALI